MSPDPNSRPAPSPKNFDPYTHEMERRRRAYYASQGREAPDAGEGWARPGWGEGFGAPKSERSEWNGEGWKERVVLALGVVVRSVRFYMYVANWSSCKTLVAGLFPTMPTTLANAFLPTYPPSTSSNAPSDTSHSYSASPHGISSSPTHHPTTPPSSSSSGGFSFPFTMDFDKRHREAVSALVQARCDREEMGVERREGLKKRVKEMEMARGSADSEAEGGCGPHPPTRSEAEGRGTTMPASALAVEELSAPEEHESEDGGVNSSSDAVVR